VYRRWQAIQAGGERPIPALHAAIDDVIDRQLDDLAIPRRYVSDLREIWLMQPRFEKRGGGAAFRLFEHIRFRAGFDFLLLRAACGELEPALADWWEHFVASDADDRLTLVQQLGRAASGSTAPKRRRRRRTSSDRGDTAPAADSAQ
jgi:poly(A) polymerase